MITDLTFVEQSRDSLATWVDDDFTQLAQAISEHVASELVKVESFQEVQDLYARTDAIARFIKKSIKDRELKLRASNDLTLSRIRIERWLGQWLNNNLELGAPNTASDNGSTMLPLSDLGLNKMQSMRFQLSAQVPDSEFERYALETIEASKQLTSSAIINWGRRIKRQSETESERQNLVEQEKILPPTTHPDCLYHDDWTSLWHGDARNLDFIQSNTVDLIVTSPPYNIGPKNGNGRVLWYGIEYLDYDDTMSEDEYKEWQLIALNEMWRVTRPGGSLFYNHKIRNRKGKGIHPIEWILQSNWVFRQQITWDRGSTHNKEMSYFWPNDELIFWLTKGTDNVYLSPEGARMSTVWRFNFETNSDHPAPFPRELPARCIRAASKEGDLVLDPFGGSMTTCKAAKFLKRKSIGVDISRTYVVKYAAHLTQGVLL